MCVEYVVVLFLTHILVVCLSFAMLLLPKSINGCQDFFLL